jgi:hypothetical protein
MRALSIVLVVAACAAPPSGLTGTGERWSAADALFHSAPRWLGADGAYTIDLGDDRSLWLFGDSFVATSPALVRTQSTMVRNSVAVMTGRDPLTATMDFAWRDGSPPTSFFAEAGAHWFWPSSGARVAGGSLVVFLQEMEAASGGLGFAGVGARAVRVADPSGPPASWAIEQLPLAPAPYDATASVDCVAIDGEYMVALYQDTDAHHGRFARWPLAAADLSAPEWWSGSAWVGGATTAAIAIDDAAPECSLHRDPSSGLWVHVASRGFGATTIAVRTAPAVEGPWSAPVDVFTPPESAAPNAFVYAGKAHPELVAAEAGALVVTYADNSFTFNDLFDPAKAQTLYWPHVAELRLRAR